MSVDMRALISYAVRGAESERLRSRKWSLEEDAFLKANLGRMTDEEIGRALGRSAIGVHLRWNRDLGLPGRSKAPNILTGLGAARMLGIEEHKIAHWVEKGFIPGRRMPGGSNGKICLIEREDFRTWALDPQHWMYFDIHKVKDAELKRLLKEASRRWGDEWWPTTRVASHHGVKTGDVKRYIKAGKLPATQIQYSYGGRHPNLSWKYWFVLKSDATRPGFKFVTRRYKNTKSTRKQMEAKT